MSCKKDKPDLRLNSENDPERESTELISQVAGFSKTDLTDVTFLLPLRIDSEERKENADALTGFTFRHFNTSFIVLEADVTRKYFAEYGPEGFHYEFINDSDEFLHKTKWINRMISMSHSPFIAVCDADAIAPPQQISSAVEMLRSGNAVMSFPFDGRFYSCDKISGDLFKRILDIEILTRRTTVMSLLFGYHSVGGIFLVNKEKYMAAGGENENIFGWGHDDKDRVKHMEVLSLPVQYTPGPLFHLWHPRSRTNWFEDKENEIRNRKEFLKTCSGTE